MPMFIMKNLYVFQINDDDGLHVFADNMQDAENFIKEKYMVKGDKLNNLDLMGSDYDMTDWEYQDEEYA